MYNIQVWINCSKEEINLATAIFRYTILLRPSPVGIRRPENILYTLPLLTLNNCMNIWCLSQNSEPGSRLRIRFLCPSAWRAPCLWFCFIQKLLLHSWVVDIWCSLVHRRHTLSFFTQALSWTAWHFCYARFIRHEEEEMLVFHTNMQSHDIWLDRIYNLCHGKDCALQTGKSLYTVCSQAFAPSVLLALGFGSVLEGCWQCRQCPVG